jgi:hypothetical protein
MVESIVGRCISYIDEAADRRRHPLRFCLSLLIYCAEKQIAHLTKAPTYDHIDEDTPDVRQVAIHIDHIVKGLAQNADEEELAYRHIRSRLSTKIHMMEDAIPHEKVHA